jgi:hypothetical protein
MTTATPTRDDRAELTDLVTAMTAALVTQWKRLATAQDTLLRALERLQPGLGATTRINTLIAKFNSEVGEFNRLARALAERWAAQDLPIAYRDGALRALRKAGADIRLFTWTTSHQAAITPLTATFYTDLIGRISEAVRRAQAFARAAQDAARNVTLGRQHAGIDSARLTADHPLSTIVYRDSARHPVKDWAHAALTYQGTVTANHGAINTGRYDLQALWFQCVDGPECVMPGGRFLPHGQLKQMVRSWFSGPAYTIKTRTPGGTNLLTIGPNHPVLTERGWVRAHLLREGDQLVYDRLSQDPTTLSELHLKEVPLVQDVYSSLVQALPVAVRSATRNDLHRDGEFCQGEVDVVTLAGSLLVEPDTMLSQHVCEHDLVRANDAFPMMVRRRSAALGFGGDGDTSNSIVRSPGTFFPGLGPGVRMPQRQSLTTIPADAHVANSLVDLVQGEAEGFGNLRRLASLFQVEASYLLTRQAYRTGPGTGVATESPLGAVAGVENRSTVLADGSATVGSTGSLPQRISLSCIESISITHYEGWVYDATTSGGTFAIDGLIVSNCGFVSHEDTDHADSTIRSADDAAAYPIAHFGCIREWIPRPDLNGQTGLVSGDPV